MAQGFFYTRALPAAALERWLDEHASDSGHARADRTDIDQAVDRETTVGRVAP